MLRPFLWFSFPNETAITLISIFTSVRSIMLCGFFLYPSHEKDGAKKIGILGNEKE